VDIRGRIPLVAEKKLAQTEIPPDQNRKRFFEDEKENAKNENDSANAAEVDQ